MEMGADPFLRNSQGENAWTMLTSTLRQGVRRVESQYVAALLMARIYGMSAPLPHEQAPPDGQAPPDVEVLPNGDVGELPDEEVLDGGVPDEGVLDEGVPDEEVLDGGVPDGAVGERGAGRVGPAASTAANAVFVNRLVVAIRKQCVLDVG